jgi:hypothetical protein
MRCAPPSPHISRRAACAAIIIALMWLQPGVSVVAQEIRCEPLPALQGDLGYRLRDDRCEGLYVRDIASNVRLIALSSTTIVRAPGPGKLVVSVPSHVPGGRYRVRVQSLDPQVNYQLDSWLSNHTFQWPDTIVAGAPIAREKLGALAWRAEDTELYVPASTPTAPPVPRKGKPPVAVAFVESTVPIEGFTARLNAESGPPQVPLSSESALPSRLLELSIPAGLKSGVYELWVRVRLFGESTPESHSWRVWLP